MNKGDFNNIKIPDELDVFIENTVEIADRQKKKKRRRIKYSSTMVAGLTVVILFCISNPAIASKIPFLGDIFSYLNKDIEKIYEPYLEYSTPINISKESNGITVTIKNAIFDGRILNFTYEIDSDRDLGDYPILGVSSVKKVSDNLGNQLEYLNEKQERLEGNSYIGQATYKVNNEVENLKLLIDLKNIVLLNEGGDGISMITTASDDEVKLEGDIKEIIDGQWTFDIELNAVENSIIEANETVKNDSYDFTIEEISISPVSFNIDYNILLKEISKEKWKFDSFDLEVKDDLGNIYKSENFGMRGNNTGWWANKIFERVNEKASKLIITPKVIEKRWLIESNNYEGMNKYEYREILLDSIEINLEN